MGWRALHAASRAADRLGPAAWTYGLYLWAAPAQKAVLEWWTLGDFEAGAATDALNDVAVMVPWLNAALSLPLCAALAWVSHVGVERPCAAAAHTLGRQSGRDQ